MNRLVFDGTGYQGISGHKKNFYVENDNSWTNTTIMDPGDVALYATERVRLLGDEHPQYGTLFQVASEARQHMQRLGGLNRDNALFIDTNGGVGTIVAAVEWMSRNAKEQGVNMTAIVGERAFSAGAICSMITNNIHCLPRSEFLWHTHSANAEAGSLEQNARSNGQTVEQYLELQQEWNRKEMGNLLRILMTDEGNTIPSHLRSRLVGTLYHSEDDLARSEARARAGDYGSEGAVEYVEDGQFIMTGAELGQIGRVTTHTTDTELREFTQSSLGFSVNCLQRINPPDSFFSALSLNTIALEMGVMPAFGKDADGDVSFLATQLQVDRFKDRIPAIVERFMQRHNHG